VSPLFLLLRFEVKQINRGLTPPARLSPQKARTGWLVETNRFSDRIELVLPTGGRLAVTNHAVDHCTCRGSLTVPCRNEEDKASDPSVARQTSHLWLPRILPMVTSFQTRPAQDRESSLVRPESDRVPPDSTLNRALALWYSARWCKANLRGKYLKTPRKIGPFPRIGPPC
jgi:hypothetical protein